MIHEDDRRILESYPEAKAIRFKKDCTVGEHYHKIKTERFILTEGECVINYPKASIDMIIGQIYTIPPGTYHSFKAKEGTVLIGLNSHPYDPQDDYKI